MSTLESTEHVLYKIVPDHYIWNFHTKSCKTYSTSNIVNFAYVKKPYHCKLGGLHTKAFAFMPTTARIHTIPTTDYRIQALTDSVKKLLDIKAIQLTYYKLNFKKAKVYHYCKPLRALTPSEWFILGYCVPQDTCALPTTPPFTVGIPVIAPFYAAQLGLSDIQAAHNPPLLVSAFISNASLFRSNLEAHLKFKHLPDLSLLQDNTYLIHDNTDSLCASLSKTFEIFITYEDALKLRTLQLRSNGYVNIRHIKVPIPRTCNLFTYLKGKYIPLNRTDICGQTSTYFPNDKWYIGPDNVVYASNTGNRSPKDLHQYLLDKLKKRIPYIRNDHTYEELDAIDIALQEVDKDYIPRAQALRLQPLPHDLVPNNVPTVDKKLPHGYSVKVLHKSYAHTYTHTVLSLIANDPSHALYPLITQLVSNPDILTHISASLLLKET